MLCPRVVGRDLQERNLGALEEIRGRGEPVAFSGRAYLRYAEAVAYGRAGRAQDADAADDEAVDKEIGADFVAHGPGGRTDTAESWKGLARHILDAMPDVKTELEDVVATGDRVVVRFTSRGTHEGEFLGVAPTGRALTTGGIEIYRLESGRIVECWGTYDMTELFGPVC